MMYGCVWVFLKRRTDDGRYLELTTMRGYNIAVYDVPVFFSRGTRMVEHWTLGQ